MNILSMLTLQDQLNKVVNPQWLTAGYAWHRAAMHEAVELQGHIGWKWWKKQVPDMPQARIELVDIWHFILSHVLVRCEGDFGMATALLESQWNRPAPATFKEQMTPLERIDAFVMACADGRLSIPMFRVLMTQCELTEPELERMYVGKNVLNMFRQVNGDKQGTYHRYWWGEEDNVWMQRIFDEMPDISPQTLMVALGDQYASFKSGATAI